MEAISFFLKNINQQLNLTFQFLGRKIILTFNMILASRQSSLTFISLLVVGPYV